MTTGLIMRRPGMRRSGVLAVVLALMLALAPGLAFARAGGGLSFGSRGGRTYMAPPSTATAPSFTAPVQRSITPQSPGFSAPGFTPAPSYGYGGGYGGRSPFVSGLMGGLIGAGIGGLLFGHGLFHGIDGFGGFFGLLLQLFLVAMVARWLFRRFVGGGQPAFAGPAMFARGAGSTRPAMGGGGRARPVAINQGDYQQFEQVLQMVQAAWSAHDLNRMRQIASPEMVSYFAEQMGEQASRGVQNLVTAVHLEQGDLSEAWSEGPREYATVAMRFSMVDVTRDASGQVVDGHPEERVQATEVWTFLRSPGGRWILSAIQQAR